MIAPNRNAVVNQRARVLGLTLIEVLIALAVIAIVTAFLSTSVVGNIQKTRTFGQRTEASQILNYIGRRVGAGDDPAFLPEVGTNVEHGYGELATAYEELTPKAGFANTALYRVEIANIGTVTLGSASAERYDVTVCFEANQGESCVVGTTLSFPAAIAALNPPPLPGIN